MPSHRTTRCCGALIALAMLGLLPPQPIRAAQASPTPASVQVRQTHASKGPLALFPIHAEWTIALNNGLTAPPAFDGMHAYFPIEGDRLVAYDLVSGTRLWIATAKTALAPAAGGGLVFLVLPDSIVALHGPDGSIAWQLPFAEPLACPLVWDNGWLIGATTAGAMLAFRASDGALLWRHDLGSPASARPALGADRVYVPLADGRVSALALDGGTPVWEHRLGGAATDLLPLADRLFVGSKDNFLYCLRTRDGSREWRWRTGADVMGVPVVDEKSVYFVSLDNILRSLERHSGVQRWKRPLPLRPTGGPLKAGDTLVISGMAPTLRGFSAKDGSPAGELALPADLAAPPHLFERAGATLPSIIVCTQDVAKGASVVAYTRSIEPETTSVAPLPNATPPTPPPGGLVKPSH